MNRLVALTANPSYESIGQHTHLSFAFELQNYKKEQHINTNTVLVNEKTKAYLLKVVTIGQPHLS
jgi:hypothetical protein